MAVDIHLMDHSKMNVLNNLMDFNAFTVCDIPLIISK